MMIKGLWGKKLGMTQVFSQEKKVIPVTAIDLSHWVVTQIKTKEKDGYNAIKMGYIKSKYQNQDFSLDWLKSPRIYFSTFKEVPVDLEDGEDLTSLSLGKSIKSDIISEGDFVDVAGITRGLGFQGVVKRHGFSGGRASHGAKFGRFTGALSHTRRQGRVMKGKSMPGHMGVDKRVMKNLKVIKLEPSSGLVLVKGSVAGKSGSFVFLKRVK
jgi:large subunit ribosomal protein L3